MPSWLWWSQIWVKAEDAGLAKCSSVAMCGSLVQGNASEVGSRQLVSNIGPDGPGLLAFLSEMLGFWQAFFFFPPWRNLQCYLQRCCKCELKTASHDSQSMTCVLGLASFSLPFCKRGPVIACCRRVLMRTKWNGAFGSFSVGLATRTYTRSASYYYCCYYHDQPSHLDGLLHCSLWKHKCWKVNGISLYFPVWPKQLHKTLCSYITSLTEMLILQKGKCQWRLTLFFWAVM